jgi:hypothetical protein
MAVSVILVHETPDVTPNEDKRSLLRSSLLAMQAEE